MFHGCMAYHRENKVSVRDALVKFGLKDAMEEINAINAEMNNEILEAVNAIKDSYSERLEEATTNYKASLKLMSGNA